MRLFGKFALLLTCLDLFNCALAAQAPNCNAMEKPPMPFESNPTTRDATVTHSDAGVSNRLLTAQACLVIGTKKAIGPGPVPEYSVSKYGLFFDWNLAIISEDDRFVDVSGTISKTGPVDVSLAGPDSIVLPLSLSWNLGSKQPKPSTNRVLTEVEVSPCTDSTSTCSPDGKRSVQVVRLLGSPGPKNTASWRSGKDTGCVAPMFRAEDDPHLRQVTVIGSANQYLISTCLVSDKYRSFKLASFNINLFDAQGNALIKNPDGNTRQNIGKLFHAPGESTPYTVTLLSVQIASVAAVAAEPDHAEITLHYIGCKDEHEANCDAQVDATYQQKVQWLQKP